MALAKDYKSEQAVRIAGVSRPMPARERRERRLIMRGSFR